MWSKPHLANPQSFLGIRQAMSAWFKNAGFVLWVPDSVYSSCPAEISETWDALMPSKFARSYYSLLWITKNLNRKEEIMYGI